MSSGLEGRIQKAESLLRERCAEISVLHKTTENLLKRVAELEARSTQKVELKEFFPP